MENSKPKIISFRPMINEPRKSTKTSFYLNCTLIFEKLQIQLPYQSNTLFGKNDCLIIPQHSDVQCTCKPCSMYRFVRGEEKNGWTLTHIYDNDCKKENNDLE